MSPWALLGTSGSGYTAAALVPETIAAAKAYSDGARPATATTPVPAAR